MNSNYNKDDLELNNNLNKDNQEELNMLEYLMAEKENETFLDKFSRIIAKLAVFLEAIVIGIFKIISWISTHMFAIAFTFAGILIFISYIFTKFK